MSLWVSSSSEASLVFPGVNMYNSKVTDLNREFFETIMIRAGNKAFNKRYDNCNPLEPK